MQFTVRDWMIDVIVFVDPDTTVLEALALMRRRYIRSLIVNKNETNPEYGIITSTDVSDKIVALQRNPTDVTVSEIMTSPLITIDHDVQIYDCAKMMKENHIHHMPVTSAEGEIMGMISATDFLVVAEAMGQLPGQRIT
jgi:signal-transduction protein with cAMP-binding, CBS, and nucleotidyltransferase domain